MPNNDLISRAAAIDIVVDMRGLCRNDVLCDAVTRINAISAVDAVPVVHARWTTERTWKHDGEWYCTACEYEPVVFMDSAFCPNCGAKMDGERREGE